MPLLLKEAVRHLLRFPLEVPVSLLELAVLLDLDVHFFSPSCGWGKVVLEGALPEETFGGIPSQIW